ncbi:hypothetical protein ACIQVL_50540 [Streptomyces sp. NPDC090499]|uniref:hypothetical protein n=1 Tax=Streptomyces sp. NPDC090499 TaxID=3365965 RepID=UPI003813D6E9
MSSVENGKLCGVQATRLDDGDLRWVFPYLDDVGEVGRYVSQADERIVLLASHLGSRATWTGCGLEFHHMPGAAEADLFGAASAPGVEFVLCLDRVPVGRDNRNRHSLPGGWAVTADIVLDCDRVEDCGGHYLEQREDCFATPLDAARALAAGAQWLWERGSAEPAGTWANRNRPDLHTLPSPEHGRS